MGGDDTYEDSTEYFKTDIEDESTENTSMIQDVTSNFITIFPNPFNNKISIKMDSKIELIKIFDVLGKLVHSEIGQGNEQILNLSNLYEGVYFLEVISKNGESHKQKIIKSK